MVRTMARRMLQQTESNLGIGQLDLRSVPQKTKQADPALLERALRKSRSKRYMDALKKLDAGGHTMNAHQVNQLLKDIGDEFEELNMDISSLMYGIVAPCYLGQPYEVHTLDCSMQIVKHFKVGEPLPANLAKARGIAAHGGYDFIEVYSGFCCAVSDSGTVSNIKD